MFEIMVAVGLLAIALTPVVAFNQKSLTDTANTLEEMIARQAIINMCERYKNETPETLQSLSANPEMIDQDSLLVDLEGASRYSFKRRIQFRENVRGNTGPAARIDGLHEVTFEVTWNSGRREVTRSLKLVRLIHWHKRVLGSTGTPAAGGM